MSGAELQSIEAAVNTVYVLPASCLRDQQVYDSCS